MRILFIASTDSRRRYRFVMEPLRSVDVDVLCFEEQRNSMISFFRGIKTILTKPKSDVAVLTGGDLRNVIWLLLFRVIFNIRVVVRFGGDPIAVRRSAQNSFIGNKKLTAVLRGQAGAFGSRFLLKYADGVIVVSEYLANSVRPMIGGKTRLIVSPPVLLKECKVKSDYSQQDDWLNVLTVANLNYKEKAEGVLIIANALLAVCVSQAHLKIKLNIVGGGLQLEKLKQKLARLNLPDNLSFDVHGQQEDVFRYFESADVFIYHSTLDSYPLVLLEAAAHGLPMVMNHWGPFPALYEDEREALFYGTADNTNLESLIIELAEKEEVRSKIGRGARSGFQQKQSLQSRGAKLKSFFQEVSQ